MKASQTKITELLNNVGVVSAAAVLGAYVAYVPVFLLSKCFPGMFSLIFGAGFGVAIALLIGTASLWLACRVTGEETPEFGRTAMIVILCSGVIAATYLVCGWFSETAAIVMPILAGGVVFALFLEITYVKAILIYFLFMLFSGVIASPLLYLLVFPTVQSMRAVAERRQSEDHLKQIGMGLLSYESAAKNLPARASFDATGKPLLSWRVSILPYLEQSELYQQFHLDEPWDSEHNRNLIEKMPEIYRNPSNLSSPGMANYLAVCGSGLAFDGERGRMMAEFRRGTANTILVVEANDECAVPWTKPDDWQWNANHPLAGLGAARLDSFYAVFADGVVKEISKAIEPAAFCQLLTVDDSGQTSPSGEKGEAKTSSPEGRIAASTATQTNQGASENGDRGKAITKEASDLIVRLEFAINAGEKYTAEDLLDEVERSVSGDARVAAWRKAIDSMPGPKKRVILPLNGSTVLEMVLIHPGSFMMERGGKAGESVRKVVISRPFYLGKYEVTQAQWKALLPGSLTKVQEPQNPVENVSWAECQEFLQKLNEKLAKNGERFTLPTEAQWEYACRAGNTAALCCGDSDTELGDFAWFKDNSEGRTHAVGGKKPNAWGLYDMHGNVWEWCSDWYDKVRAESPKNAAATRRSNRSKPRGGADVEPGEGVSEEAMVDPVGPASGSHRVFRGGCAGVLADQCLASHRPSTVILPKDHAAFVGFRVAWSIDPSLLPAKKPVESNAVKPQKDKTGTADVDAAGSDPEEMAEEKRAGEKDGDGLEKKSEGEKTARKPLARWDRKKNTLDLGVVKIEFVPIPEGSFMMGDANGDFDENPVHEVTISQPYYLSRYEVTQKQWEAVMGNNPSQHREPQNPVDNVSWDDCQTFMQKLNGGHGVSNVLFSLPTEAQWECACRAECKERYCYGEKEEDLAKFAWYQGGNDAKSHPVGKKKPNAWRLFDMHGNVGEWCADWYDSGYYAASVKDDPTGPTSGFYRVVRGGGWEDSARTCRSASRDKKSPELHSANLGFRIAINRKPDTSEKGATEEPDQTTEGTEKTISDQ